MDHGQEHELPSSEDKCYFDCSKTDHLITVGPVRLQSIIDSSKKRNDTYHVEMQKKITENPAWTIKCHKSCVSSYTSKEHISRFLKRQGIHELTQGGPPRSRRRANEEQFEFKKHCFICGKECLAPDTKNPNRWRTVRQCKTVKHPEFPSFKDYILHLCDERGDITSDAVRKRVHSVIDLHAADAQYHLDCYQEFISKRNINTARRLGNELKTPNDEDEAFNALITSMMYDPSHIWTSLELHQVYCTEGGKHTRKYLVEKLKLHFDKDLVILNIQGCASLLCFKEYLPLSLKLVESDDTDEQIDSIAQRIFTEVKSLKKYGNYDLNEFTLPKTEANTSPTLLKLMNTLVSNAQVTQQSLSLTQSVQQHITKQWNQM